MIETISFWLSKILWALITPSHVIVLFLILSFVAAIPAWLRICMRFIAAFFLFVAIFLPIGEWAILPLEQCFEERNPPMQIDGVIVLGGAIDADISLARKTPALNGAAERVTSMLFLMKNNPQAQFVYSGGSGSIIYRDFREADFAKRFLTDAGMNVDNVIFETESRNTFENVEKTKEIFSKIKGQNWMIVTSAYHMPRAIAHFDRAAGESGTHFFPYEVDYKTPGTFNFHFNIDLAHNLSQFDLAMREYVGLGYALLRHQTLTYWPCGTGKGQTHL